MLQRAEALQRARRYYNEYNLKVSKPFSGDVEYHTFRPFIQKRFCQNVPPSIVSQDVSPSNSYSREWPGTSLKNGLQTLLLANLNTQFHDGGFL